MNGSSDSWVARLVADLNAVPGAGAGETVEQWAALAAQSRPVVTVFGPYDSGKSSLIKRLLVDDGRAVPPWLTISARRETFEAREVEAYGCVLCDTPGIAGGDAAHEEAAQAAAELTDAFVVVLPPQLTMPESLLTLLSGRCFHADGWALPADAVTIVVGRMDEAGVDDPDDSPDDYGSLVSRKRVEFDERCRRSGIDPSGASVHCVAADPYQSVGNREVAGRSAYDAGRSWDGMSGVERALARLPPGLDRLRDAARVRFHLAAAQRVLEALREESQRQELALEEATSMLERKHIAEGRLTSLVAAARADLDGVVEEELLSVVRDGGAQGDDVIGRVEPRLRAALERWASRHDAQIEKLANELSDELFTRASRPAALALRDFLESTSPTDAPKTDARKVAKATGELAKGIRQGLAVAHHAHVGMPLETARSELRKLSTFKKPADYFKKARGFKDAAHSARSAKYLTADAILGAAAPALIELAALVWGVVQDHAAANERAARREALREQVAAAARSFAKTYLEGDRGRGVEGWMAGVEQFESRLTEYFRPSALSREALATTVQELKSCGDRIEATLAAVPGP